MVNAIDKIKISGFRRLVDFELEMRPFTVLIGANGVGKTSFLDALSLLSASALGNLSKTFSEWGGATNLLTRDSAKSISYCVDVPISEHFPLEYYLSITPTSSGHYISEETLAQAVKGSDESRKYIGSIDGNVCYYHLESDMLMRPDWDLNPMETSLAQAPKRIKQSDELRKVLINANPYHIIDMGLRAPVKMPQTMKPADLPGANAEDMIPYLYYLRESYPNRFETIIDTLKVAFPDFENLNFPPVAAGMLTMTWSDKKFSKPISIHELSEGTLRFLWLLSLLYSPNLSSITMIDEPEVSLHPEMLSLLSDAMREASMRTQLVVATHSDRFVRFLQPEEIVVMDITEDGTTTATWADKMDLNHWLVDFSLDEIWQMGVIGGRAW